MIRTSDARASAPPGMRDLVAILARRVWLVLLVAIPVMAASTVYSYTRTPLYAASTNILVRPALVSLTVGSRSPELDAQTESNLATSTAVATLAGETMGSSLTPQQLLKHVSANMVNGTQFLTISFSDADPEMAQQGATAFANAYLEYGRVQAQAVIEQQRAGIDAQLQGVRVRQQEIAARLLELPPDALARQGLQSRREVLAGTQLFLQNQLVTLLTVTSDPGEVVDPAVVPTAPRTPRHEFDIAVGVLLGLGLGVATALLAERGSDAVRTPGELEQRLAIPALGAIPRVRRLSADRSLVVAGGQRTLIADAFRRLRTGLLGIVRPTDVTILVTSAVEGEGKTLTVANLAAALAEIGRRVIVVSADLRRPRLHEIFPSDDRPGLSRGLVEHTPAWELVQDTDVPNLRFVPSGVLPDGVEPVNLLQSDRMLQLLQTWSSQADVILLDSPAVLGVPDSLVLARSVDGVVFVADADADRWDDIVSARDELERAGGDLIATVLNGAKVSRRDRRRARRSRAIETRPSNITRLPRSAERPEAVRQEL